MFAKGVRRIKGWYHFSFSCSPIIVDLSNHKTDTVQDNYVATLAAFLIKIFSPPRAVLVVFLNE